MKAQDLKNSIIQLAIQGKLVEQREDEGTAKELLEQIKAEKEKLIKEGKIKKTKPLPEITEDEIPFDIPDTWKWARFGEVVNFNMGKTPPRSEPKYWKDDCNWVSIADMIADGYILETKEKISEIALKEKFKMSLVPKGTLLMSFKLTVGRVSILNIDAVHNEAIISIYPYADLEESIRNYLFTTLPLLSTYGETKGAIKGKTLNSTSLNNLLIPLPPLEEQKRIVAKIEELMTYVDQYDKAYTAVEELNKKFPEDMQKSILQYAIQGKLVEQRKEDGTAEELCQQIQAEKEKLIKKGKIKKTKPLPEITEDEIPFDIPDTWKWVRVADIFDINPRNNVSDEIGVSFIPMALIEDGYVSQFTYEVKAWGNVKKGYTHFQDGDIVMAKITPCFQNLKSALMINLENGVGAGTTELHVLRLHSDICREFFMWFIKSPIFVSTCVKNMTGTAGQKRVPTDVLKNYVVPLPPLAEQRRIVEKIEELLPYTKQLVKKID